jgi:hypothetical protein
LAWLFYETNLSIFPLLLFFKEKRSKGGRLGTGEATPSMKKNKVLCSLIL